jgi:hypothetical protein
VQAEVYDAVDAPGAERFDPVYTGIGAVCWLPDIERWTAVVAELLAPGGRVFMREGHPMLWTLADSRADGLLVVEYPYFEREPPSVFSEHGTYVQTDAIFEWNHGLAETVTALLAHGLRVSGLVEHDSVPWMRSRARWKGSSPASSASPIAPGDCRTATRCRPSSRPERARRNYLASCPRWRRKR